MVLIAWAACSLSSALVFVWWSHAMKAHNRADVPIALHPTTVQGRDLAS
jgi:hypothetical protein